MEETQGKNCKSIKIPGFSFFGVSYHNMLHLIHWFILIYIDFYFVTYRYILIVHHTIFFKKSNCYTCQIILLSNPLNMERIFRNSSTKNSTMNTSSMISRISLIIPIFCTRTNFWMLLTTYLFIYLINKTRYTRKIIILTSKRSPNRCLKNR